MKQIVATQVWYNGNQVNAVFLNVSIQSLHLGDSANIKYQLFDAINSENNNDETNEFRIKYNQEVQNGYLIMNGDDYNNWGNDDNYIWDWVANKLNLEII